MQRRFEKPDRVSVTPPVDTWYWLPGIRKTYDRDRVASLFGGKAVLSGNIPPNAPVENINCLHEAAVKYGRY